MGGGGWGGSGGSGRSESTPRLFMSGATGRLNRSQLKYPMPNQLRVYVKRCRDLKACDKNMIGEDSSDPYIVIQARSEKYKTATHYRTLDPLVDEEAILHCSDPSTVLHVSVMDEDVGMDDMVGQWIITCKYLVMDPTYVEESCVTQHHITPGIYIPFIHLYCRICTYMHPLYMHNTPYTHL